MMKKLLFPLLGLPLLCACVIQQPGMYGYGGQPAAGGLFAQRIPQPAANYIDEVVQVVTDPPGAGILVNNTYYGPAPVQVTVRRYWRGAPGSMVLDPVAVKARPGSGQCEQELVVGQGNVPCPPQLLLNMYNCPAGPAAGKK